MCRKLTANDYWWTHFIDIHTRSPRERNIQLEFQYLLTDILCTQTHMLADIWLPKYCREWSIPRLALFAPAHGPLANSFHPNPTLASGVNHGIVRNGHGLGHGYLPYMATLKLSVERSSGQTKRKMRSTKRRSNT